MMPKFLAETKFSLAVFAVWHDAVWSSSTQLGASVSLDQMRERRPQLVHYRPQTGKTGTADHDAAGTTLCCIHNVYETTLWTAVDQMRTDIMQKNHKKLWKKSYQYDEKVEKNSATYSESEL
jgi:hypothetical protein